MASDSDILVGTSPPADWLDATSPVDRAAYYLSLAADELHSLELYREDVDILAHGLRRFQTVVIDGTERGRRAALLKARREETKSRAQDASIIQRGPDPAADLLRAANQTVGG